MDTADIESYVAIVRGCGCCVGACVDDGETPDITAGFLRDMAKCKYAYIERKTVGWVRENLKLCRELPSCGRPTPPNKD